MRSTRRLPASLALLLFGVLVLASPAVADDAPGADDNVAVAVNTEDGASVFRLAFSVRMVANGVIDEENRAYALARCSDCQTVALAFQVVLVWGDANVVVPENEAVAYNDRCVECLTYASATQIVLGFDGPVRFTAEGRQRLADWYRSLSELEKQVGDLSVTQLNAAILAAKSALIAILDETLVAASAGKEEVVPTTTTAAGATSTTTSTAPAPSTPETTDAPTTTSTSPSSTSSTTTTTSSSTTASSTSSTTTTTAATPTTGTG